MDAPGKKEKVLHARVPESLDQEVRQRAHGLGISVSNLVRNVLLNSFGLVEDIVVDGARIARSATGDSPTEAAAVRRVRGAPAQAASIVGWRELVLNLNAVCAECNALLPKGTRAAMGVWQPVEGPFTTLCSSCLERLGGAEP